MLIAPAGYGKTHTIVECLKYTVNKGRQLILTHTHAGVASIKEKIKKEGIPSSSYHVETISSFAQKYVMAFYCGNDIPDLTDSGKYYPFIMEKATRIITLTPIKKIILHSYTGLFVDEYQDCTTAHHSLILALANIIPTHILGDYLQGIFGFNSETLIDLKDANSIGDFMNKKAELTTPQRWLNGNNEKLGYDLKEIRRLLENKEEIDLTKLNSLEVHLINEEDLNKPTQDYYKRVSKLLNEDTLLILHPDSTSIHPRLKIVKHFNNRATLLESIDDKDYYKISKQADSFKKEDSVLFIRDACLLLFNRTGVNNWFNNTGLKNKTKDGDKALLKPILEKLKCLETLISFELISDILSDIQKLPEIKCYRKDLFYSFLRALEEAQSGNISVYQAMVNKRNLVRRIGRKIYGRCIGTTLLTKGLEFDTVAIINAHKFDCPKHLYVALTRASKRLVIFTNNKILRPYSNS
jgi:superfamily I DNA/RNA helicase